MSSVVAADESHEISVASSDFCDSATELSPFSDPGARSAPQSHDHHVSRSDAEIFDAHVSILKRLHNIVPLASYTDAVQMGAVNKLPATALVITLDDGHLGNYRLKDVLGKAQSAHHDLSGQLPGEPAASILVSARGGSSQRSDTEGATESA
jgi:hypothetical protein